MNEKQVVIGTLIWLLFGNISKNDPVGKLARKRILRDTKKALASYRTKNPTMYLKLVHFAHDTMLNAYSKMELESIGKNQLNKITPSGLLDYLEKKEPEILNVFNFEKKHRDMLRDAYSKSGLGFPTMMYVNRLLNEIDVNMENAINMSKEELNNRVREVMQDKTIKI